MSDIDAIRKRLAECSIPVGMQPVIRAEQLYELLECAARYPEDVAALLARIDEMQRENDRLRLRIEGMKGHERFDDHIQKVELSRLEELLSHLGSWRAAQGHCYDLTNPEAEVQPIIDRIDEQAAEIERLKAEPEWTLGEAEIVKDKIDRRIAAEIERLNRNHTEELQTAIQMAVAQRTRECFSILLQKILERRCDSYELERAIGDFKARWPEDCG